MKIILSRKGWDSGYGKRPSPIFPDSTIQSLPIECVPGSPPYSRISPTVLKPHRYDTLAHFLDDYHPKLGGTDLAHLDPDLDREALPRVAGWRPCFGQDNGSQAARHLDLQGVGVGDIFLFYGWFDDVVKRKDGGWIAQGRGRHVIFGWLQVGDIIRPGTVQKVPTWLRYHPHIIHATDYVQNRIYVAATTLTIGSKTIDGYDGGGIFCRETQSRSITKEPGHRKLYPTKLPRWLTPTKHRQEHVWEVGQSLDAQAWIRSLFD